MNPPAATENVMMICPNLKCKKVLRVPAQFRGQRVKCHYCQITFEVPASKPAPAAVHPAADPAKPAK